MVAWILPKKKKVLRLKGGDVSFFSRVSQEINFLKKNKIRTIVFSGITSSQASLKKAQSSFFNRSNFCNLITGHKIIKKKNKEVNYNQICENKGKIIIYMGVGQINLIISNLIANGINKNEKVTIVENASFKSERLFFTTLKNCPMFIKRNNISNTPKKISPIGVYFREKISSWYYCYIYINYRAKLVCSRL